MKQSKHFLALILSVVMMLSVSPMASATRSPTFSDVPTNHWAYAAIEDMAARGVVSGIGGGKFAPDNQVSPAQFSVMLGRLFFNDEMSTRPAGDYWWQAAAEILMDHGVLDGTTAKMYYEKGIWDEAIMNAPMNRYDMAQMMYGCLKAKNITMPSKAELDATRGKIGDYNSIPAGYVDAVVTMYTLGCLAGVDTAGNFAGTNLMTRAQACVVLSRLLEQTEDTTPVDPTPNPEPDPEPTPDPEPSTGIVGTISDTPVTLSLDTHKPVVDYWSSQSADIKALTDKDAFNAACSTIANTETIITQGEIKSGVNKYFNYAVCEYDTSDPAKMNVNKAMSLMSGDNVKYGSRGSTKNGFLYYIANPTSDKLMEIFEPIFAKFTPGMTDREKATICVQAVIDRFDYEVNGDFTWENGKQTGDCNDYANAIRAILQAAGIPSIGNVTSDTSYGGHAWAQALIDGEWVVIDGPAVENGHPMFMSFSQHANLYGYNSSDNNVDSIKIARALLEAVE